MTNPPPPTTASRRYDIDWLRVLAVLLLVPFHSALIFSLDPGLVVYVKDVVESPFLLEVAGFVSRWHMPLLFLISGMATWFALGFRSGRQYLWERVLRLLVPAVFAILVLVPLMTNLHLLGTPAQLPFPDFYQRFLTIDKKHLDGVGGTFTPAHVWFILYLLVLSLVALPLFLFFRRASGQHVIAGIAGFASRPGLLYLLALLLPVMLLLPGLADKNPFYFLAWFIYGYVLVADARLQPAVDHQRWISLVLALVCTVADTLLVRTANMGTSNAFAPTTTTHAVLFQLSAWWWVLAMLGFAHQHLNANSPVLRYVSEAAFPFYLLHLPVNTLVGYFVIRMNADIALKYALINLVTVALTLAVYEVCVRRTNLTRFLFGMKPLPSQPAPKLAAV